MTSAQALACNAGGHGHSRGQTLTCACWAGRRVVSAPEATVQALFGGGSMLPAITKPAHTPTLGPCARDKDVGGPVSLRVPARSVSPEG